MFISKKILRAILPISILFCILGSLTSFTHDPKFYDLLIAGHESFQTTSLNRVKKIDSILSVEFKNEFPDSIKAIFYQFKVRLATRDSDFENTEDFVRKSIQFAKASKDDRLLLMTYLNVAHYFQKREDYEIALQYVDSIKSHPYKLEGLVDKRTMLAGFADIYRSSDDLELYKQSVSECLSLDPSFSGCRLLQANIHMFYDYETDREKALKILWGILLDDPQVKEMTTVWSLQSLTQAYIDASHFNKAQELLDLILSKAQNINKETLSSFHELHGDLECAKGNYEIGFQNYLKSLEVNEREDQRSKLLLKSYLLLQYSLDNKQWEESIKNKILVDTLVNNNNYSATAALALKIKESPNKEALQTHIATVEDFIKQKLIEGSRLKIIFSLIKSKAATFNLVELYREFEAREKQTILEELLTKSIDTDTFINAQLGIYENQIFETDIELKEKERSRKTLMLYFGAALALLLLVSIFYWQSQKRKRKIEILSHRIAEKNKMLLSTSKDYEFMLLTLGHHVKEPVNQFKYSIDHLQEIFEKSNIENEDTNIILSSIADSNNQLSNRLTTLLNFISHRVQSKGIQFEKIDLRTLVEHKKGLLENVKLDYSTQMDYLVFQHKDSIEIILDNIIENVLKYGDLEEQITFYLSKSENKVILKVTNSIKNVMLEKTQKMLDIDKRRSYNLGFLIIKYLCSELNIHFSYRLDGDLFISQLEIPSIS